MNGPSWFSTELTESSSCADRFASFRFRRPEGFRFVPGQYVMLRITTEEGPKAKPFTLSQAPGDPFLEVTTRVSQSPYKQALSGMRAGDPAEVSTARGDTVLPEGATSVALLTGGVGITPARSILRDIAQAGRTDIRAILFYGNADEVCVPFLEEFQDMSAHPWFDVVLVYQYPPEGWQGESGFITAEIVRRHIRPDEACPYVVSGPPAMIDAMERVMDDLAVPQACRLVERFTGY